MENHALTPTIFYPNSVKLLRHLLIGRNPRFLAPFTPNLIKQCVKRVFQMNCMIGHEKYLGLPLFINGRKSECFQQLMEKAVNKLDGRYTKFLSKAGRVILAQSVLANVGTFAMNFLIPTSVKIKFNSL